MYETLNSTVFLTIFRKCPAFPSPGCNIVNFTISGSHTERNALVKITKVLSDLLTDCPRVKKLTKNL